MEKTSGGIQIMIPATWDLDAQERKRVFTSHSCAMLHFTIRSNTLKISNLKHKNI